MQFYVGYDWAQPAAAEACVKSLERWVPKNDIYVLDQADLRKKGVYWRMDNGQESTSFTYTRFLVPHLNQYKGTAVFCDGDFLWRRDPYELHNLVNTCSPVQVVKHDLKPEQLKPTKMDGKVQAWYPRKNWSSMMMFNCYHAANKNLSPEAVSTQSPQWLHQFQWCNIDDTLSLPIRYNHLVGYYPYDPEAIAVHFTDGGPWLPGYEDVDYADEWLCTTKP